MAWKFDILTTIFVCFDTLCGIGMYTFNPFTNYALKPWEENQIYEQENGHPFTVFKFIYQNGELFLFYTYSIYIIILYRFSHITESTLNCNFLTFDKTLSLGDYPIRALANIFRNKTVVDENVRGLIYKNGSVTGVIAEVLITAFITEHMKCFGRISITVQAITFMLCLSQKIVHPLRTFSKYTLEFIYFRLH